jgi:S1-C subfamily serine protease
MTNGNHVGGIWSELSRSLATTISNFENSVVAVHAAGRNTTSGVVWRPNVVVTVRQSIRRRETVRIIHSSSGEPVTAHLAGVDPGTDLAVLRIDSEVLKPVEVCEQEDQRVGELVLAVGRSRLGDLSASAGIIARIGKAWRTWQGGEIDRLLRPDVRLYIGQTGSGLVDGRGRVLGINSNVLARNAVITVPSKTVNRVVDTLLERGSIPRPYLGVAMQAVPMPETVRSEFPQDVEQALLVMHVESGAPAAKGGVLVGDLIVALGDEVMQSIAGFQQRLSVCKVGDTVPLTVIRGGTKTILTLQVASRD